MKRIQYTEEQEKKLIEMSQYLYPKYKEIHINGAWMYFDKGLTPLDTIPIFEFCMTYLIEKLNDLSNVWEEMPPYVSNVYGGANGKWNIYTKFHFHYPKDRYKKHFIDYLYKEFKKLK